MRLRPEAGGTRCQVLLCTSAKNSDSIAALHWGSDIATVRFEGSSEIQEFPYRTVQSMKILGLVMPAWRRVRGAFFTADAGAEAIIRDTCTWSEAESGAGSDVGAGCMEGAATEAVGGIVARHSWSRAHDSDRHTRAGSMDRISLEWSVGTMIGDEPDLEEDSGTQSEVGGRIVCACTRCSGHKFCYREPGLAWKLFIGKSDVARSVEECKSKTSTVYLTSAIGCRLANGNTFSSKTSSRDMYIQPEDAKTFVPFVEVAIT
jgi:hypothetical protein